MKTGYNLNIKQIQKLSMTPELQQAIKLLQFNSIELNEFIKEQIEENPLLEMEARKEEIKDINKDKDKDTDINSESQVEREAEIDWKEYIEKYDDISYKAQIDKNKEETSFENFVKYTPSLKEYLLQQLGEIHLEDKLELVANYIIENLDENGYFKIDLAEIASLIKVDIEIVKEALEVVQSLDPTGVGAVDLRDCLLLQTKEKGIKGLVEEIIKNHLEDLSLNRVAKIAKELNVSIKRIQEAMDDIKTLEPKPGRAFNSVNLQNVKYITPDASIEKIDGQYKVVVNDVAGPRLNINKFYKDLIGKDEDDKTTTFLTERLNSATWVIKSIEQRRNTIKKVLESILKHQIDFFEEGEKALKPLTLKTVADDIDMHESTISRTTNAKYVQTPRGVFELKYFFTSGLNNIDGDVSSTSIKSMIEDIIESEDSKKPYSDQAISELLKDKGTKISRRTIAKYRDELQIPSSTLRRRFD